MMGLLEGQRGNNWDESPLLMLLSFLENFSFSRYWNFHEEVFAPRHLVGVLRAQLSESCPTLCNPMDCRPPGSSVHGLSKQEYWSGFPNPPPGDLHDPGIEPSSHVSSALQVDSLSPVPPGKPSKTPYSCVKRVLHVMRSNHKEGSGRSWPSAVWTLSLDREASLLVRRAAINLPEMLAGSIWGMNYLEASLTNELSDVWACCLHTGFILPFGTITYKFFLVSYLLGQSAPAGLDSCGNPPRSILWSLSRLAARPELWKPVGTWATCAMPSQGHVDSGNLECLTQEIMENMRKLGSQVAQWFAQSYKTIMGSDTEKTRGHLPWKPSRRQVF